MNFYHDSANILQRIDAQQGSIKGLISTLPEKSRKRTAALVIESLKYRKVLNDIIEKAALFTHEKKHLHSKHLVLLLVHDLLFTKGGIQASDGPIKQAILRHRTRLQAELAKIKIKRGVTSNEDLACEADPRAAQIPRYVRVNTLKWDLKDALEYLSSKGFLECASALEHENVFAIDEHIPNLLSFHPKDKASCFPAYVLSPDSSIHVALDATSAPGNKTTHLSSIMRNNGRIFAFEKDQTRFLTLQNMLKKVGCRNVEAFNQDFLTVDPQSEKFREVTHILLDPSCSGSGIVNRLDHLLSSGPQEIEKNQSDRLEKLAAFQLLIIKHAMTFPNVQKIVYSTCSIHAVENEQVVTKALDSDVAKKFGLYLAPRSQIIEKWKRRGIPEEMGQYKDKAESVIRCIPGDDKTNGFFVSCFIRYTSPTVSRINANTKRRQSDLGEDDIRDFKEGSKRKKKRK